ncbi:RHS repeat domain-containing protein [Stenotrophomonas rhizophila]|uniref:RHS repeat domain-containing protein n=1 Tax=Stenotrophomonas rhizophila TaxID=216778 RepID=UPI001E608F86|nr:RHS repeat-associated core domain-containing protein [Stenotrophomonas rhizophila]
MKMRIDMVMRCASSVFLALASFAASGQEVVRYVHTDALGSPVAESDEAGTIVARFAYEPYGGSIGQGLEDAPGYTGHVSDASTGLTYMQQRYYDPDVAVFLSVDPVTATSDPIDMFNRYRYADGNPYRFIDPDGRQACGKDTTCQLAQGAAGTTVGNVPQAPSDGARKVSSAPSSSNRWSDIKGRLGLNGDLTKNGNIFDVESLFHDVFYPAMNSPGGPALKVAGLGVMAVVIRSEAQVVFRTGHYASRLESVGLNVARTEAIIGREVARVRPNMAVGADVTGRIRVNGVVVEYRMRALPNGGVNVGTIFPVK